jgi:hypothetical protein
MSIGNLQRRTFLKGVGATLALPLLDAMLPDAAHTTAFAAANAASPPTRMAFVFVPNGVIMPAWKPTEAGTNYTLPETLQPLAKLKGDINVITGLAQDNGRAKGDGPGDHARSAASFLTGAHPVKTSGADIRVGMSVDQAAAEKIGHLTKLPSLELGIERGREAGSCDSGYSCAYSSAISWKTESTPMAKEINPRLVYERLFGSAQDSGKDREKGRRDFYRQSILDLVSEDAAQLKNNLGQTDRRKIDEYLSSVRELEQRIQRSENVAKQERPDFDAPEGVPSDLQVHIRLMFDLMVLAFQTDTTRVSTFMLANEGSNRSYRMVGVNDGHHQLSHHQSDQEKVDKIKKIDRFLVTEFAYFLDKLKSVKEGTGTLLDNSMILYGSGISDGNRHRHDDLPVILAGRANGTIRTGRHIVFDTETPMNNLFLSMLDRTGANIAKLGDSSGRLKGLEG